MKRTYFAGHKYVEFSKQKKLLQFNRKNYFHRKSLKKTIKGRLSPLRMMNPGKHKKIERTGKRPVLTEQIKGLKSQ